MNNTPRIEEAFNTEEKDLLKIEENINFTIKEFHKTKKQLCFLFAHIKLNKLYEQIDLLTFKDYVKSRRLKISYNTALEYAKIGELLLKYEKQFSNVNFGEMDGFKKLLYLEKALSYHEPAEVFHKLKEESFKNFAQYSKPARAGCAPAPLKKSKKEDLKPETQIRIFEENGKLYIDSNESGSELLTFNTRLLEDKKRSKEYKTFMTNIILTAMDYFKNRSKKEGSF